jgi:glucosamine-6-phosphate deaminase
MTTTENATPVDVFSSADEVGSHVATLLLERIAAARSAGRRFLLGCPTGRTPRPIYSALAARLSRSDADISHLILVMMDEYLVKSADGFTYASSSSEWSCHHFAETEIRGQLNRGLRGNAGLRSDSIWFPHPANPTEYDERIAAAGGVDFFILASGASDGHVAFNPPGSARASRTRVIELSDSTRRDNLQTFPAFKTIEAVPTHGISVGIDTIARAKEAAMVVWGSGKRQTLARMRETRTYDPDWPATIIHEIAGGRIICDAEAAGSPGKP